MIRRGAGRSWTLGLAGLFVLTIVAVAMRGVWLPRIAAGLVCEPAGVTGDVIVVENFNPSYVLFERAAALQRTRPEARVVVPVVASARDPGASNPIDQALADVMVRFARLERVAFVAVRAAEPYALTTASQVGDFLVRERVGSVLVVTSAFRSRRSALVYRAVLEPAGIAVACAPVFEGHTSADWWRSWHGIEVVVEQFLKLQFYRFYVLRGAVR